ncbi:hypothetical protein [Amycolatopsis sp. lyj-84]|uniref:WXG100-like domain-containing protein n=1 Tax=Amycolatopsis sp. lyj-84 TaxID=2789284 RepID=UPI00397E7B28
MSGVGKGTGGTEYNGPGEESGASGVFKPTELPQDLQNFFSVVVGLRWPEANLQGMILLRDFWRDYGAAVEELLPQLRKAREKFDAGMDGESSGHLLRYIDDELIPQAEGLAEVSAELKSMVGQTAADVEKSMIMLVAFAVIALISFIALLYSVMPFLAGLVVTAFREVGKAILKGVLLRLLQQALAKAGPAALAGLRELFKKAPHILLNTVKFGVGGAAFMAGLDATIQGIQLAPGGLREKFDSESVWKMGVGGAIGGAGAGVVSGIGRTLSKQFPKVPKNYRAIGNVAHALGQALAIVLTNPLVFIATGDEDGKWWEGVLGEFGPLDHAGNHGKKIAKHLLEHLPGLADTHGLTMRTETDAPPSEGGGYDSKPAPEGDSDSEVGQDFSEKGGAGRDGDLTADDARTRSESAGDADNRSVSSSGHSRSDTAVDTSANSSPGGGAVRQLAVTGADNQQFGTLFTQEQSGASSQQVPISNGQGTQAGGAGSGQPRGSQQSVPAQRDGQQSSQAADPRPRTFTNGDVGQSSDATSARSAHGNETGQETLSRPVGPREQAVSGGADVAPDGGKQPSGHEYVPDDSNLNRTVSERGPAAEAEQPGGFAGQLEGSPSQESGAGGGASPGTHPVSTTQRPPSQQGTPEAPAARAPGGEQNQGKSPEQTVESRLTDHAPEHSLDQRRTASESHAAPKEAPEPAGRQADEPSPDPTAAQHHDSPGTDQTDAPPVVSPGSAQTPQKSGVEQPVVGRSSAAKPDGWQPTSHPSGRESSVDGALAPQRGPGEPVVSKAGLESDGPAEPVLVPGSDIENGLAGFADEDAPPPAYEPPPPSYAELLGLPPGLVGDKGLGDKGLAASSEPVKARPDQSAARWLDSLLGEQDGGLTELETRELVRRTVGDLTVFPVGLPADQLQGADAGVGSSAAGEGGGGRKETKERAAALGVQFIEENRARGRQKLTWREYKNYLLANGFEAVTDRSAQNYWHESKLRAGEPVQVRRKSIDPDVETLGTQLVAENRASGRDTDWKEYKEYLRQHQISVDNLPRATIARYLRLAKDQAGEPTRVRGKGVGREDLKVRVSRYLLENPEASIRSIRVDLFGEPVDGVKEGVDTDVLRSVVNEVRGELGIPGPQLPGLPKSSAIPLVREYYAEALLVNKKPTSAGLVSYFRAAGSVLGLDAAAGHLREVGGDLAIAGVSSVFDAFGSGARGMVDVTGGDGVRARVAGEITGNWGRYADLPNSSGAVAAVRSGGSLAGLDEVVLTALANGFSVGVRVRGENGEYRDFGEGIAGTVVLVHSAAGEGFYLGVAQGKARAEGIVDGGVEEGPSVGLDMDGHGPTEGQRDILDGWGFDPVPVAPSGDSLFVALLAVIPDSEAVYGSPENLRSNVVGYLSEDFNAVRFRDRHGWEIFDYHREVQWLGEPGAPVGLMVDLVVDAVAEMTGTRVAVVNESGAVRLHQSDQFGAGPDAATVVLLQRDTDGGYFLGARPSQRPDASGGAVDRLVLSGGRAGLPGGAPPRSRRELFPGESPSGPSSEAVRRPEPGESSGPPPAAEPEPEQQPTTAQTADNDGADPGTAAENRRRDAGPDFTPARTLGGATMAGRVGDVGQVVGDLRRLLPEASKVTGMDALHTKLAERPEELAGGTGRWFEITAGSRKLDVLVRTEFDFGQAREPGADSPGQLSGRHEPGQVSGRHESSDRAGELNRTLHQDRAHRMIAVMPTPGLGFFGAIKAVATFLRPSTTRDETVTREAGHTIEYEVPRRLHNAEVPFRTVVSVFDRGVAIAQERTLGSPIWAPMAVPETVPAPQAGGWLATGRRLPRAGVIDVHLDPHAPATHKGKDLQRPGTFDKVKSYLRKVLPRLGEEERKTIHEFLSDATVARNLQSMEITPTQQEDGASGWLDVGTLVKGANWLKARRTIRAQVQMRVVTRRYQHVEDVDGLKVTRTRREGDGVANTTSATHEKMLELAGGALGDLGVVKPAGGGQVMGSGAHAHQYTSKARNTGQDVKTTTENGVIWLAESDVEVRVVGRPPITFRGALTSYRVTTAEEARATGIVAGPDGPTLEGEREPSSPPAVLHRAMLAHTGAGERLAKLVIETLRKTPGQGEKRLWKWGDTDFLVDPDDPVVTGRLSRELAEQVERATEARRKLRDDQLGASPVTTLAFTHEGTGHTDHVLIEVTREIETAVRGDQVDGQRGPETVRSTEGTTDVTRRAKKSLGGALIGRFYFGALGITQLLDVKSGVTMTTDRSTRIGRSVETETTKVVGHPGPDGTLGSEPYRRYTGTARYGLDGVFWREDKDVVTEFRSRRAGVPEKLVFGDGSPEASSIEVDFDTLVSDVDTLIPELSRPRDPRVSEPSPLDDVAINHDGPPATDRLRRTGDRRLDGVRTEREDGAGRRVALGQELVGKVARSPLDGSQLARIKAGLGAANGFGKFSVFDVSPPPVTHGSGQRIILAESNMMLDPQELGYRRWTDTTHTVTGATVIQSRDGRQWSFDPFKVEGVLVSIGPHSGPGGAGIVEGKPVSWQTSRTAGQRAEPANITTRGSWAEPEYLVSVTKRTLQVVESSFYGKAGRRTLNRHSPAWTRLSEGPGPRPRDETTRAAHQFHEENVLVWLTADQLAAVRENADLEQQRLLLEELPFPEPGTETPQAAEVNEPPAATARTILWRPGLKLPTTPIDLTEAIPELRRALAEHSDIGPDTANRIFEPTPARSKHDNHARAEEVLANAQQHLDEAGSGHLAVPLPVAEKTSRQTYELWIQARQKGLARPGEPAPGGLTFTNRLTETSGHARGRNWTHAVVAATTFGLVTFSGEDGDVSHPGYGVGGAGGTTEHHFGVVKTETELETAGTDEQTAAISGSRERTTAELEFDISVRRGGTVFAHVQLVREVAVDQPVEEEFSPAPPEERLGRIGDTAIRKQDVSPQALRRWHREPGHLAAPDPGKSFVEEVYPDPDRLAAIAGQGIAEGGGTVSKQVHRELAASFGYRMTKNGLLRAMGDDGLPIPVNPALGLDLVLHARPGKSARLGVPSERVEFGGKPTETTKETHKTAFTSHHHESAGLLGPIGTGLPVLPALVRPIAEGGTASKSEHTRERDNTPRTWAKPTPGETKLTGSWLEDLEFLLVAKPTAKFGLKHAVAVEFSAENAARIRRADRNDRIPSYLAEATRIFAQRDQTWNDAARRFAAARWRARQTAELDRLLSLPRPHSQNDTAKIEVLTSQGVRAGDRTGAEQAARDAEDALVREADSRRLAKSAYGAAILRAHEAVVVKPEPDATIAADRTNLQRLEDDTRLHRIAQHLLDWNGENHAPRLELRGFGDLTTTDAVKDHLRDVIRRLDDLVGLAGSENGHRPTLSELGVHVHISHVSADGPVQAQVWLDKGERVDPPGEDVDEAALDRYRERLEELSGREPGEAPALPGEREPVLPDDPGAGSRDWSPREVGEFVARARAWWFGSEGIGADRGSAERLWRDLGPDLGSGGVRFDSGRRDAAIVAVVFAERSGFGPDGLAELAGRLRQWAWVPGGTGGAGPAPGGPAADVAGVPAESREAIRTWRPDRGDPQAPLTLLAYMSRLPLGNRSLAISGVRRRYPQEVIELVQPWVLGMHSETDPATGAPYASDRVALLSGGVVAYRKVDEWWHEEFGAQPVPAESREAIRTWRPDPDDPQAPRTLLEYMSRLPLGRLQLVTDSRGRYPAGVIELIRPWVLAMKGWHNPVTGKPASANDVAGFSGEMVRSGAIAEWWRKAGLGPRGDVRDSTAAGAGTKRAGEADEAEASRKRRAEDGQPESGQEPANRERDLLLPGAAGSGSRMLDQGRTELYRADEPAGEADDLRIVRVVSHNLTPMRAMNNAFPFRDPNDPQGRVYEPYADENGQLHSAVVRRADEITAEMIETKAMLKGIARDPDDTRLPATAATELTAVWPALERAVAAEMRRLVREEPLATPVVRVGEVTEKHVREHERALVGENGLFLSRRSADIPPAEWPSLRNGRILGVYLGAVLDSGETLANWEETYRKYPSYAMKLAKTRNTMSAEGAANFIAFANTATEDSGHGLTYDHDRINAVFVKFRIHLFDKGENPRAQTIAVLMALDNAFDRETNPDGVILVDYGDDYLRLLENPVKAEPEAAPDVSRYPEVPHVDAPTADARLSQELQSIALSDGSPGAGLEPGSEEYFSVLHHAVVTEVRSLARRGSGDIEGFVREQVTPVVVERWFWETEPDPYHVKGAASEIAKAVLGFHGLLGGAPASVGGSAGTRARYPGESEAGPSGIPGGGDRLVGESQPTAHPVAERVDGTDGPDADPEFRERWQEENIRASRGLRDHGDQARVDQATTVAQGLVGRPEHVSELDQMVTDVLAWHILDELGRDRGLPAWERAARVAWERTSRMRAEGLTGQARTASWDGIRSRAGEALVANGVADLHHVWSYEVSQFTSFVDRHGREIEWLNEVVFMVDAMLGVLPAGTGNLTREVNARVRSVLGAVLGRAMISSLHRRPSPDLVADAKDAWDHTAVLRAEIDALRSSSTDTAAPAVPMPGQPGVFSLPWPEVRAAAERAAQQAAGIPLDVARRFASIEGEIERRLLAAAERVELQYPELVERADQLVDAMLGEQPEPEPGSPRNPTAERERYDVLRRVLDGAVSAAGLVDVGHDRTREDVAQAAWESTALVRVYLDLRRTWGSSGVHARWALPWATTWAEGVPQYSEGAPPRAPGAPPGYSDAPDGPPGYSEVSPQHGGPEALPPAGALWLVQGADGLRGLRLRGPDQPGDGAAPRLSAEQRAGLTLLVDYLGNQGDGPPQAHRISIVGHGPRDSVLHRQVEQELREHLNRHDADTPELVSIQHQFDEGSAGATGGWVEVVFEPVAEGVPQARRGRFGEWLHELSRRGPARSATESAPGPSGNIRSIAFHYSDGSPKAVAFPVGEERFHQHTHRSAPDVGYRGYTQITSDGTPVATRWMPYRGRQLAVDLHGDDGFFTVEDQATSETRRVSGRELARMVHASGAVSRGRPVLLISCDPARAESGTRPADEFADELRRMGHRGRTFAFNQAVTTSRRSDAQLHVLGGTDGRMLEVGSGRSTASDGERRGRPDVSLPEDYDPPRAAPPAAVPPVTTDPAGWLLAELNEATPAEPARGGVLPEPDLFGLLAPAEPPEFLRGHDHSEITVGQGLDLVRKLDLKHPAPDWSELAPDNLQDFDDFVLTRELSEQERHGWAENAGPLPARLQLLRARASIWLGGPLDTGSAAKFEMRENITASQRELRGWAPMMVFTDVPRASFERAGRFSDEAADGSLTGVREMLSWAEENDVLLVNVHEVFHSGRPMPVQEAFLAELAKQSKPGYTAASDLLRMALVQRFGLLYSDGEYETGWSELAEMQRVLGSPEGYGVHKRGEAFNNDLVVVPKGHPYADDFFESMRENYGMRQAEVHPAPSSLGAEAFVNLPELRSKRYSVESRTGPVNHRKIVRELGHDDPARGAISGPRMTTGGQWLVRPRVRPSIPLSDREATVELTKKVVQTLVRELYNRDGDLHLTLVADGVLRHETPEVIWTAALGYLAQRPEFADMVRTVTDRELAFTPGGPHEQRRVDLPERAQRYLRDLPGDEFHRLAEFSRPATMVPDSSVFARADDNRVVFPAPGTTLDAAGAVASQLPALPGVLTVGARLTPDGTGVLRWDRPGGHGFAEFAELLRERLPKPPAERRILLVSCDSAELAKVLSEMLDAEVIAPAEQVWQANGGLLIPGPVRIFETGEMSPAGPRNEPDSSQWLLYERGDLRRSLGAGDAREAVLGAGWATIEHLADGPRQMEGDRLAEPIHWGDDDSDSDVNMPDAVDSDSDGEEAGQARFDLTDNVVIDSFRDHIADRVAKARADLRDNENVPEQLRSVAGTYARRWATALIGPMPDAAAADANVRRLGDLHQQVTDVLAAEILHAASKREAGALRDAWDATADIRDDYERLRRRLRLGSLPALDGLRNDPDVRVGLDRMRAARMVAGGDLARWAVVGQASRQDWRRQRQAGDTGARTENQLYAADDGMRAAEARRQQDRVAAQWREDGHGLLGIPGAELNEQERGLVDELAEMLGHRSHLARGRRDQAVQDVATEELAGRLRHRFTALRDQEGADQPWEVVEQRLAGELGTVHELIERADSARDLLAEGVPSQHRQNRVRGRAVLGLIDEPADTFHLTRGRLLSLLSIAMAAVVSVENTTRGVVEAEWRATAGLRTRVAALVNEGGPRRVDFDVPFSVAARRLHPASLAMAVAGWHEHWRWDIEGGDWLLTRERLAGQAALRQEAERLLGPPYEPRPGGPGPVTARWVRERAVAAVAHRVHLGLGAAGDAETLRLRVWDLLGHAEGPALLQTLLPSTRQTVSTLNETLLSGLRSTARAMLGPLGAPTPAPGAERPMRYAEVYRALVDVLAVRLDGEPSTEPGWTRTAWLRALLETWFNWDGRQRVDFDVPYQVAQRRHAAGLVTEQVAVFENGWDEALSEGDAYLVRRDPLLADGELAEADRLLDVPPEPRAGLGPSAAEQQRLWQRIRAAVAAEWQDDPDAAGPLAQNLRDGFGRLHGYDELAGTTEAILSSASDAHQYARRALNAAAPERQAEVLRSAEAMVGPPSTVVPGVGPSAAAQQLHRTMLIEIVAGFLLTARETDGDVRLEAWWWSENIRQGLEYLRTWTPSGPAVAAPDEGYLVDEDTVAGRIEVVDPGGIEQAVARFERELSEHAIEGEARLAALRNDDEDFLTEGISRMRAEDVVRDEHRDELLRLIGSGDDHPPTAEAMRRQWNRLRIGALSGAALARAITEFRHPADWLAAEGARLMGVADQDLPQALVDSPEGRRVELLRDIARVANASSAPEASLNSLRRQWAGMGIATSAGAVLDEQITEFRTGFSNVLGQYAIRWEDGLTAAELSVASTLEERARQLLGPYELATAPAGSDLTPQQAQGLSGISGQVAERLYRMMVAALVKVITRHPTATDHHQLLAEQLRSGQVQSLPSFDALLSWHRPEPDHVAAADPVPPYTEEVLPDQRWLQWAGEVLGPRPELDPRTDGEDGRITGSERGRVLAAARLSNQYDLMVHAVALAGQYGGVEAAHALLAAWRARREADWPGPGTGEGRA